MAVVIDGACLGVLFSEEHLTTMFYKFACRCQSVICCRVSPLQKVCPVCMLHVMLCDQRRVHRRAYFPEEGLHN